MESLHDVTDRCENKVGIVQISGRYHRYQDANHGFRSVRSLESDYVLTEKVLGTGYNGEVRMATSKERPEHKFAVKAFDFTGVPAQRRVQLESEVEVFLCMDHPHIARLVDVYERDQHMDLVMECMMGGELLDRIREQKRFSEKDTAQHVWQMLLALNYVHSHGMIHCDLKLENFMYDHKDSNHLKLIDFGFSKMCDKKAELRRKACGTLSYTAPEVLDWSYTQQCDQWSLGVIVFVLLAGYMPFSGPEMEQMKNISTGTYVMKQERWSNISEEARAFTRALLQVDPKKRLTAETALDHPFISNRHFDAETQVDARIVKALRDFGHQSRFRRCCMSMMAWSLNQEEREKVEKYFLAMDSKHQGAISYDDMKKVMVDKFHLPRNEAKRAFDALDTSHHKEIHFSDFLAAMINSHVELHEELVHEAFRKFDTDDSGYITVDNLRTVLGDTFEGQKVEKLLNEADTAHHGQLTYHEFASYLTGKEIHLHGDEGIGLELPMNESRHKMPKCNGNIQPCCSVQ
jgi:calcium-dependent protein kinase